MYFKQIVQEDLGCASYTVCSTQTRECAVVDPRWEIEPHLDLAAKHRYRIAHIVETHSHADHVSGRGRLAAATGARITIHEDAGVDFVCRGGRRSRMATAALTRAGHPSVFNLAGGMIAWKRSGLPLGR